MMVVGPPWPCIWVVIGLGGLTTHWLQELPPQPPIQKWRGPQKFTIVEKAKCCRKAFQAFFDKHPLMLWRDFHPRKKRFLVVCLVCNIWCVVCSSFARENNHHFGGDLPPPYYAHTHTHTHTHTHNGDAQKNSKVAAKDCQTPESNLHSLRKPKRTRQLHLDHSSNWSCKQQLC